MAEHTPGPWEIFEWDHVPWITHWEGKTHHYVIGMDEGGYAKPTWEDARLIAAAPTMLEALEALYDSAIEGHDDFSRYIVEQAGPAIAKARGKS